MARRRANFHRLAVCRFAEPSKLPPPFHESLLDAFPEAMQMAFKQAT